MLAHRARVKVHGGFQSLGTEQKLFLRKCKIFTCSHRISAQRLRASRGGTITHLQVAALGVLAAPGVGGQAHVSLPSIVPQHTKSHVCTQTASHLPKKPPPTRPTPTQCLLPPRAVLESGELLVAPLPSSPARSYRSLHCRLLNYSLLIPSSR